MPGRLTDVAQVPGRGVSGSVDRHPVRVGDPSWLGAAVSDEIGEPVAVEVDGRVLGHLRVADEVRDRVDRSVRALVSLGVPPLLVCDCDGEVAARLASKAGIDDVHTGLDSASRAKLVRRLQEDGHTVLVVGDAEANAEALARADLAVSRAPTPARHLVLLEDLDVGWVARAVRLCRQMRRRLRANRVLALTGTLLPLPFCAVGLLSPWGASLLTAAFLLEREEGDRLRRRLRGPGRSGERDAVRSRGSRRDGQRGRGGAVLLDGQRDLLADQPGELVGPGLRGAVAVEVGRGGRGGVDADRERGLADAVAGRATAPGAVQLGRAGRGRRRWSRRGAGRGVR